jgi:hypothetical protein
MIYFTIIDEYMTNLVESNVISSLLNRYITQNKRETMIKSPTFFSHVPSQLKVL